MNANEEGQGGEVTVDSLGRSAVFSQQAVRFLLSRVRREMAVIVQKFRLRVLMTFQSFQKFRLRILVTFQTFQKFRLRILVTFQTFQKFRLRILMTRAAGPNLMI
ncbi:hypothetical protein AVEN_101415-1 [Araneus ventricosus]|uniref:Uncharacterized protein n=1 Tax=Araneus ventricosus TaxID=182803 RepID=A0A4Y2WDM0_ARAVE|nr:hypothetical protein AVEN_101415-1 [Araneus ventricosus]